MVYTQANLNLTAAGTAQRMASSRTPAAWVLCQALIANSGVLYVGGCDPTNKQTGGVLASSGRGIPLSAGESMLFPAASVATPYDLQEMWFDGTVTGDDLSVTYLTR